MENLEQQVRDIVVEQLGVKPEQVTREARFTDDLGADSLDTVELIMSLEDRIGMTISEVDAAKLTTFGAVVDYLKARQ